MRTAISWKGSVGKGWHKIVENAVDKIENNHNGWILQIKEKFGGLRIYTSGGDYDAIDTVVKDAEGLASVTCEECGGYGQLCSPTTYWVKTLCPTCLEKMKEKN